MQKKRLVGITIAVAILLCVPLVAMQFTDEVNWTLLDFVIAGFLLLGVGLTCELATRIVTRTAYRIAFCAGLLAVFFLIWAELAVGVFGTRFAGS